ncbi:DUF2795 domain-containing protein [Streptomyces sp. HK10]|uniref:DUF2795 domain-containing protein n=1 Tax=Streptomyces sp. HK10 TaxID=3373255 RepID=UPI003747DD86
MAKISDPIELRKVPVGVDHPAGRESLVRNAKDKGAKKDVVEELSPLGRDRFDGPDDVGRAVSGKG